MAFIWGKLSNTALISTTIGANLITHSLREISHHMLDTCGHEGRWAQGCGSLPGPTGWWDRMTHSVTAVQCQPHLCPHRYQTLQGTLRSLVYSTSRICPSPHPFNLMKVLVEIPPRWSNIQGTCMTGWSAKGSQLLHAKSEHKEKDFLRFLSSYTVAALWFSLYC